MKIAIIGSGISGLTCAHYLHSKHNITVFEANDYIGGHTATVDVKNEQGEYAIDTGFIVFNDRTYPNFRKLIDELHVKYQPTEMSFSVRNDKNGLEYNGNNIFSLFSQKQNLFNPKFYYFIYEILRFNKKARNVINSKDQVCDNTLNDFLVAHKFSDYFCQNYILPMGAAIWSSTLSDMRSFPLKFFLQFFLNHGLLDVTNRPQWFVISGGSREYVKKMVKPFSDKIRLSCQITKVKRTHSGVDVFYKNKKENFDQVIFACHSNQALAILSDPSTDEISVLKDLDYQDNDVILHDDVKLLPKSKAAWASWNYRIKSDDESLPTMLTYNMNILQGLDSESVFCVTLNQRKQINSGNYLKQFIYAHPVFSNKSIEAQKKRNLVSGVNNTWYCGAYWRNGFHEDGVQSALDVVNAIKTREKQNTNVASAVIF